MRRHEHLVRPGRQASLPASFSRNAREAGMPALPGELRTVGLFDHNCLRRSSVTDRASSGLPSKRAGVS